MNMDTNPFKNMNMPNIDMEGMVKNYKKNLETIYSANQVAADVMTSLSNLQNKFMNQALDDLGLVMKKMMTDPMGLKSESGIQEYMKMAQNSWGKSVNHGKEVSEMMNKTGSKVSNMLRERVRSHMEEVGDFMNHAKNTKH